MMLFVTLFACLILGCSACYKPAANLQGGVNGAVSFTQDEVITQWSTSDSLLDGGFELDSDGTLIVPWTGLYYVYAQVFLISTENHSRVEIHAGDTRVAIIHKDMPKPNEGSGFSAGVVKLNEGDKIYVKVVKYNTNIWVGVSHTFLGAYLI